MIRRIDIENGRLCNVVVQGNIVSLEGQVPEDGIEAAEAQTPSVLREIDACWQRPAPRSATSSRLSSYWPTSAMRRR
jgi:hypothetical protein